MRTKAIVGKICLVMLSLTVFGGISAIVVDRAGYRMSVAGTVGLTVLVVVTFFSFAAWMNWSERCREYRDTLGADSG